VVGLPQVDFPPVQVTTATAGREPRRGGIVDHRAAGAPARPDSLAVVDAVDEFVGVSQISLQFDLNRDIDGATQDVQAASTPPPDLAENPCRIRRPTPK